MTVRVIPVSIAIPYPARFSRIITKEVSREEWFSLGTKAGCVIEVKENNDLDFHKGVGQPKLVLDELHSLLPALELMINPFAYRAETVVNGSADHLIWKLKHPWFFEDGPLVLKE